MISARQLVRLIENLVQSENHRRSDFLAEIWLKSEYLRRIPAERQPLIYLFINTIGENLRSYIYKFQRGRTMFEKEDKEAFKATRNTN